MLRLLRTGDHGGGTSPESASIRFWFSVAVVFFSFGGCRDESPPMCSDEARVRLLAAGVSETQWATACSDSAGDSGIKAEVAAAIDAGRADVEAARNWKMPPVRIKDLKADIVKYKSEPALVYGKVEPSDYYNYGYQNARGSHYALKIQSINEKSGETLYDEITGYAPREKFKTFFEDLRKQAQESERVDATLVLAVLPQRYDSSSADHIEILDARLGRDVDLDPGPAFQALQNEQAEKASKIAALSIGGCSPFTNAELGDHISKVLFGANFRTQILSRTTYSRGKTAGLSAEILKLRLTSGDGYGTVFKESVYVHYSCNPKWSTFEDIMVGAYCEQSPGCTTRGGSFRSIVKQHGYTGKVP